LTGAQRLDAARSDFCLLFPFSTCWVLYMSEMTPEARRGGSWAIPLLFGVALFVGAALLFCVQPMIVKMILPKFGGAPAVWNTCMVFFQVALLAGYVYAHATVEWLGVRRQAVLHLGVVALPWLVLPVGIARDYAPGDTGPIVSLLALLSLTVGLPFFVVSTSAPLLQSWFAACGHRAARDPYFLYAASNAGSMFGLLAYPFVLEPRWSLSQQSKLWAAGFALLAMLFAACTVAVWRLRESLSADASKSTRLPEAVAGDRPAIGIWTRLHWVALAFAPSSLMLGVTTFLTTDVAPVPMLWVVPLALYLLSFILVFSRLPGWVHRLVTWLLPVFVVWQTFLADSETSHTLKSLAPAHLATFFVAAMVCHGELARRRPAPARLTEFYLWVSLGGTLGGLFNALVAPLVFAQLIEYPLAMVCACALAPLLRGGRTWLAKLLDDNRADWRRIVALDFVTALVVGLVAATVYFYWPPEVNHTLRIVSVLALCVVWVERPLRFGLSIGAVVAAMTTFHDLTSHVQYRERSFYGVLMVSQRSYPQLNFLVHGPALHGAQIRNEDPNVRNQPLIYYHRAGPMGQLLQVLNEKLAGRPWAIVGLGVGSMAAYGRTGQELTFFEIDPAVERVARDARYFTFVRDCPARMRMVLGDARIELARQADAQFALIVVDAFSGDAVPAHLLTEEALLLYRRKLAPGGAIAFHISNRYLRLAAVLGNLAKSAGWVGLDQDDVAVPVQPQGRLGWMASHWVVMAQDPSDLGPLTHDRRWKALEPDPRVSVWTDDFYNLMEVFEWPSAAP
jgi:hypothetical protein